MPDLHKQRLDMYVNFINAMIDRMTKDEIQYEPFETEDINYIVKRVWYKMQKENGNIEPKLMKSIEDDPDIFIRIKLI